MKIDITFDVHGTKDEVEAREALLRVLGTGIAKMNVQLWGEASKIRIALPETK